MAFLDSGLHVNEALTDLCLAFRQDQEGYCWNKILPQKVVRHRSDYIRQIDKGQLLRLYDLRVGAGGRVKDVQFKIGENLKYNAVDYAVEAVMRATESSNADAIIEYEQELIYNAMIAFNQNLEYLTIKNTVRSTTFMTNNTTLTGGDRWDQYNSPSSDPIMDIKQAALRIKSRTGYMPNVLMMHDMVWDVIQRHPRSLERAPVHPSGSGIFTKEAFERVCDLPPGSLITTSMTYNTALEDQTASYTSFIGPDVIMAYVAPSSTRNYGLGQSFMWAGQNAGDMQKLAGAGIQGPFVVYQFPDNNRDPRGANVLRIVGGIDQKILNTDAEELFVSVVDGSNTAAYGPFLSA